MDIFQIVLFILPAYFANALPVVTGGGTPLDLGKKYSDGRRILGPGKTIRGFIGGVIGGIIIAWIISQYYLLDFFPNKDTQILVGMLLSLGTMIGDSFGSFIKRRMDVEHGKTFRLDQILFIVIALILAFPFTPIEYYSIEVLGIILIGTYILHPLTNFIAHGSGLKKVPW